MPEVLEWPELEEMSKEELLKLVQSIRQDLVCCEDAQDMALGLAEQLRVDLRV
jgi:hypothetical protein